MWEFFLKNDKFTGALIVAIVVVGVVSIFQIPKESNPEIDIPVAVISTVFPGASAVDVEELATDPIEDKLVGLDEVEKITSVSRNGLSLITVQFDANSETSEKISDLKDKVDLAKTSLPEDANDPIVQKISFSDLPIITLSLSGPFELPQLKGYAEELRDDIERISGISSVTIIGGQEREIQVIINRARLDGYGLSVSQVTKAIAQANTDIPIGSIETAQELFTIRFAGRLRDVEEISNVPIIAYAGAPILVRDVARVVDGYGEEQDISRLSVGGSESKSAISLKVFKVSGGNVLQVVDKILEATTEAQKNYLPENLVIEKTEDNASQIRNDLHDLIASGAATVAIVIILLFLLLGLREALLAGVVIPLTLFVTFPILLSLGFTLNFLVLFSLILSIGILIDSSIVVTEAMHVAIKRGKDAKEAAVETIRDFKMPVIAGTLTTVFAFLPMMLTSGIIGKFIKSIPVTVGIVLTASLFVALGIVTTLGATWLKRKKEDNRNDIAIENTSRNNWRDTIFYFVQNKYDTILTTFLQSKKYSRQFMLTLIILFFVSVSLPVIGILKINMFPVPNMDTFFVDIEMPIGTTLAETDRYISEAEELLRDDERIKSMLINVGSSANSGSIIESGSISDSHLAHIVANLRKKRKEKSSEIVEEYQKKVTQLFGGTIVKASVTQQGAGPGDAAPVEVVITGDDLDVLEKLGEQFVSLLKEIPGTINIKSSVRNSNGEFVVEIDRIKAKLYGASTAELASTLRNAVFGSEATSIRRNNEDVEVIVKYRLDPSKSTESKTTQVAISAIGSLTITTGAGDVPLSTFVTTKLEGGRSIIEHEDGKRVVRLTSYTKKGFQAQDIFNALQSKMSDVYIPDGYTVRLGGEREDIQQSFSDMFRAMILGVFMIAGLLVWQFKSYRQPLFILATIPLALIGVLPGLLLVGQPLSFPGIIGIVALAGIVVNNAIILIDKINKNRYSGLSIDNAIKNAAKSRVQPILLTTVTTIAGLLPLTLTNPTWGPLGYTIIFGLLFSTVLTLIMIPLLYQWFGERDIS